MEAQEKAAFLFVDIETTGLDSTKDQILQIGAKCVTKDLDLISANAEEVVFERECRLEEGRALSPFIFKMHETSGLLKKVEVAIQTETRLMAEFALWLQSQSSLFDKPVVIAGSSIHFDRRFLNDRGLQALLPDLQLSHRMLDVSAFRVLADAHGIRKFEGEPAHTALADIEVSIAQLKYYAPHIFGVR